MPDFYGWHFPALDAPALRTMPERLSEIVNVKDWGAVGNASTNDAGAIQNAINYCMSTKLDGTKGGTVFFPNGNYVLGSTPLTAGSSDPDVKVDFVGSGKEATEISFTGADWLLSKGGSAEDAIARVTGMTLHNTNGTAGTGALKITGKCVSVTDCHLWAMVCLDASGADGALIKDINLQGNDIAAISNSATPYPTTGVGIYLGNGCTAIDCRGAQGGFGILYALSGRGASCQMCSAENQTIAARLGWAPSGEVPARGCTLQGLQTEKCHYGVELYNCEGCYINGNIITTTNDSQAAPQAITGTSWSATGGGTATATVATPHFLTGPTLVALFFVNSAWTPVTRYVLVTPVGTFGVSTTFNYALATSGGASSTGQWQLPTANGLRCRIVTETMICGNAFEAISALAAIDLDYGGAAQARNNVFMGSDASRGGWLMPTVSRNLAGWKFINCGIPTMPTNYNSDCQNPNPHSKMNYADLPGVFTPPGSGFYPSGPFEGQEFDIKDGCKSLGPEVAAVFDEPVIGGGSTTGNKYKVRWNGSSWRRIG